MYKHNCNTFTLRVRFIQSEWLGELPFQLLKAQQKFQQAKITKALHFSYHSLLEISAILTCDVIRINL